MYTLLAALLGLLVSYVVTPYFSEITSSKFRVSMGMVKDDGNKYYKRLNIKIDKDLPKDTFIVKLKCYD